MLRSAIEDAAIKRLDHFLVLDRELVSVVAGAYTARAIGYFKSYYRSSAQ